MLSYETVRFVYFISGSYFILERKRSLSTI